jgi:hypothetical protein
MVWLTVGMLVVFVSGMLLWDYFLPADGGHWVGALLAMGFYPTLLALWMGQISPWMLLGVVGFLWAERSSKDLAAGAALALLMIKPHVTYLFFLAVSWWIWRERRWWIPLGWLAALVGASGLALLLAPDVFTNYIAAIYNPPLGAHSTTVGTWLRVLISWELSWLQFVPSLLGGLGLLGWLWGRRGAWRWEVVAGPLLLASVITVAYGYSYDQVVLLPAVAALVSASSAKRPLERVTILGALLASQVGLWALNHRGIPDAFNVWHAPVLAGLYGWATGGAAREERLWRRSL